MERRLWRREYGNQNALAGDELNRLNGLKYLIRAITASTVRAMAERYTAGDDRPSASFATLALGDWFTNA